MSKLSRLLTALAALLILVVFVAPIWRIALVAPQYPEGLGMRIHVNDVRGATPNDLNNINNLNHYIGMKVIEADAIPELRVMPWIVAALAGGALVVALAGRRRLLHGWLAVFLVVGLVGLADFWRWEYDYGHNLDLERAIIKIPGASYQPPLIGSKQILNFRATSWPDVGGVALGLAFGLGLVAAGVARRDARTLAAEAGSAAATDAAGRAAATSAHRAMAGA